MGQLAQYLREHPSKSFLSDIETNPKQCMDVTLRNGKELEVEQKIPEAEKKKGETEIKENMEVEIEVNNREEQQKSN